ncbi:MAG: hypothetical protein ACTS27_01755 [Phycisphaerales bacterium]
MDEILESIAEQPGLMVGLVAVTGCILVGFPAVVMGIYATISGTKERERSRRELAAYVAEGSMTPDDAERLLSTAQPSDIKCHRRK